MSDRSKADLAMTAMTDIDDGRLVLRLLLYSVDARVSDLMILETGRRSNK